MNDIDHAPSVGCFLTTGDSLIAERLAHCELDYLCIDLQHGFLTESEARYCIQAISTRPNIQIWVRPSSKSLDHIGRLCDWGVHSLLLPMIETPDEVAAAIDATRYPPSGSRSFGPIRPSFVKPVANELLDRPVQVFVMIETLAAIDNLEEIAAVPGLSGIYFGPTDLGIAMGYGPRDPFPSKSRMAEVMRLGIETARRHGIFCASHAPTPTEASTILKMGFDHVTLGSDLVIFAAAINELARQSRSE